MKLELLSAAELGALVNDGQIKPSEVMRYFIARIQARNPSVNAFTYTMFDYALSKAKEYDQKVEAGVYLGPFAGVPFALKDFLPSKAGWQTSHGGVRCLMSTDEVNSVFCDAVESLGGIAVGKTNAPSYGFRGVTDNKLYGVTKNPFDTSYNAGGSSGGSAVAVADGMVLIAEGGDAGGSIRVPACFNNLFGFKAGVGVIPSVSRPDAFAASHPYCAAGGLTKTVTDAAILLNAMSRYDSLDPTGRPCQTDYVAALTQDVGGKKIAYTLDFDIFSVEQCVKDKFLGEIERLKAFGFDLTPVHFHFRHTALELARQWCFGITVDPAIELNLLRAKGADLLKDHKDDFPEEFVYWKERCDKATIMDLYEFNLARTEVLDELETVFKTYDYILSPISCVKGVPNGDDRNTKGPEQVEGVAVDALIGWCETYLTNFSGHPAASIPCGFVADTIPFGIQAIAPKFHDADLLALAYQMERCNPWRDDFGKALERAI